MEQYLNKARKLIEKIEIANGIENAERIFKEFQTIIGDARRSKKGKEELPFILELQKDAKENFEKYENKSIY